MSLFGALGVGVNALQAHSSQISSISQNISNASTVGYRENGRIFHDLIHTDQGSLYSASGARASNRSEMNRQGTVIETSVPTDIAIAGNGFFIVKPNSGAAAEPFYTRAGHFSTDKNGDLVNMAGYFLQGWQLDANGNLATNLSPSYVGEDTGAAALSNISIQQINGTNVPTTTIELQINLTSSQPSYTGTYDALVEANNMASGNVQPHYTRNVNVIDTAGTTRRLDIAFLKTSINQWAVEVYGQPASAIGANPQVASGTVTFNGDGSLAGISSGLAQAIPVAWQTPAAANSITLDWGTAGVMFGTPGATVIGRTDGLTQFDGQYRATRVVHNGSAAGTLENIEIDEKGFVTAYYNNDTTRRLYKIPLANFLDPNQLDTQSGDVFFKRAETSAAIYGQPGTELFGKIRSSALEQSNVDMAEQMADLIVAQRAYQSNTKVITASDEMLRRLSALLGN